MKWLNFKVLTHTLNENESFINSYIIFKQEMMKIYAENQIYSQIQAPDWFNRFSTLVLLDILAARQQRHLHFLSWNNLFLAKKIHLLRCWGVIEIMINHGYSKASFYAIIVSRKNVA